MLRETPHEEPFDPIDEAYRQWEARGLPEPLPMAAATSIIRAQQLVSTTVDRALRPLGLTFARYEVLMILTFSQRGALPVTKMGERLMVHPTGVTKLVDRLCRDGLVRREPNPDDRRGVLVHITAQGRRLAASASEQVGAVRFGVDLDDDSLHRIVASLAAYRHGAGDL